MPQLTYKPSLEPLIKTLSLFKMPIPSGTLPQRFGRIHYMLSCNSNKQPCKLSRTIPSGSRNCKHGQGSRSRKRRRTKGTRRGRSDMTAMQMIIITQASDADTARNVTDITDTGDRHRTVIHHLRMSGTLVLHKGHVAVLQGATMMTLPRLGPLVTPGARPLDASAITLLTYPTAVPTALHIVIGTSDPSPASAQPHHLQEEDMTRPNGLHD